MISNSPIRPYNPAHENLVFAAVLALGTVVNAQMPMLTAAEKADGWKLMFDGKSLAGWRGYKTETPPTGWTRRRTACSSATARAAI